MNVKIIFNIVKFSRDLSVQYHKRNLSYLDLDIQYGEKKSKMNSLFLDLNNTFNGFYLRLSINDQSINKENMKFMCKVCEDEYNLQEKVMFQCGHYFCKSCVEMFFSLSILEGNINQIKCLEKVCTLKPNFNVIKQIVSEKDYLKYIHFNKIQEILNDKEKIVCPMPDCDSFGKLPDLLNSEYNSNMLNEITKKEIVDKEIKLVEESNSISKIRNNNNIINILTNNPNKNKLTCENGHEFCSNCNHLWHPDQICQEFQDKEFLAFLQSQNKDYKNCPKCGIWTEKMIGCNHIKCSSCKYEWCWLCNGIYSPTHYSEENSKCRGRMYEGQNLNLLNHDINGFNDVPDNINGRLNHNIKKI